MPLLREGTTESLKRIEAGLFHAGILVAPTALPRKKLINLLKILPI
jgi:hypothetical protein